MRRLKGLYHIQTGRSFGVWGWVFLTLVLNMASHYHGQKASMNYTVRQR